MMNFVALMAEPNFHNNELGGLCMIIQIEAKMLNTTVKIIVEISS